MKLELGPSGDSWWTGSAKDKLLQTAQFTYSQLYNAKHVADTLDAHLSQGGGSEAERSMWSAKRDQARSRQKYHTSRLGKGDLSALSSLFFRK